MTSETEPKILELMRIFINEMFDKFGLLVLRLYGFHTWGEFDPTKEETQANKPND